jgi:MFS family permease
METIGETHAQKAVMAGESREPLVALLVLITAVQALATFAVFALPTLAPRAAASFGVAPQSIGYQVSVVYLAAALMSGYAGLLVRRFGACTMSLTALGCCAMGLLGLSSGNIAVTVAASLCIGIGYAMTNPAAAHLLLRFAPAGRRNLIFAIKQAGVPIGAMLAATMLPRLSEQAGWQGAIAMSATLLVALAVPLISRRARWDNDRAPDTALKNGPLAGIGLLWWHPVLRSLAVTGFCYAGFQVCLIAFAVTMLVTEMGWTLVEAGLIAAVMQLAGMTGRITWSLFADRFGHGLAILTGLGLAAASFALATTAMTISWPAWAMMLVLAAFGSCLIGWNGIYMAETARASGARDVGLATGGVLMFNFAGVIVAPATFGIFSKLTGSIAVTFGIFAVLPLIGALALIPAIRYERAQAVVRDNAHVVI